MKAKNILVPVDFSDATPRVAEVASSMAAAFGGRLILLHVEEPVPEYVGFEGVPPPVPVTVPVAPRVSHQQLEDLKLLLTQGAVEVTALYLHGAVVDKILREARAHAVDLIVIGSHGHGALYNLLVGSVTSGVLKDPPCPVLVVPAREPAS